jgi:hypothetical protein
LGNLYIDVNFFPDGDGQCDVPGIRGIPISKDGTAFSNPYRIDTDSRAGGCQQIFSLRGRDDIALDVSFVPDGDPGQCGNPGTHTVDSNTPVTLRIDTDGRGGGCQQAFRLRRR